MRTFIRRSWNLFLLAAAVGAASAAFGQDAAKISPKSFTEKIDNADVQVFEYSSKPGDKEPMHSHRINLVYIVQGGKLRYTFADGKTQEVENKTGDYLWRPAIKHAVENIGTTEVKAVIVELKCAKAARAMKKMKKM
jgi:beta-alanine degradation protein BauB